MGKINLDITVGPAQTQPFPALRSPDVENNASLPCAIRHVQTHWTTLHRGQL